MKRTNQEYLLLAVSLLSSFAIAPFAVYRFYQGDSIMGTIDLAISLGMAAMFVYIIRTHKVLIPSILVVAFTALGSIASISINGTLSAVWIFPVIVAAYYLLTRKWALIFVSLKLVVVFPILFVSSELLPFLSIIVSALLTSVFGYFFSKNIEEQHQQLTNLAIKDSLTGTGNRRALDEKLEEVITAHQRKPYTVSMILLDIDHFKRLNDEYGHIVGDQILVQISKIIEGRIRTTDALYRFGGEEFVIVPLDQNLKSAGRLADQLRILVENNALVPDNPVTISLGVAEYIKGESSEAWIKRADDALYNAKNNGRNQVCIAE